jgi:hypothetical protein
MPVHNTLFWLDFSFAEITPETAILEELKKTSKASVRIAGPLQDTSSTGGLLIDANFPLNKMKAKQSDILTLGGVQPSVISFIMCEQQWLKFHLTL